MSTATLVVPGRHNGPDGAGHGGTTAGLLAALVGSPAVAVSLRAPVPLERALPVTLAGGVLRAADGDTVVAEAEPCDAIDVIPPVAVDPAAAKTAAELGAGWWSEGHPFPRCYACGPERAPGDGLRLFPGAVADGVFACAWTPVAENGLDTAALCWAAIDCPTSAPAFDADKQSPVVLARLEAQIDSDPHLGEPHAIVTWALERDGRKRWTAGTISTAGGRRVMSARALWIELRSRG